MAGPVESSQSQTPPPENVTVPVKRPLLAQTQSYVYRFRLAYVALALFFWGAVAGGTVLLSRDRGESAAWSTWKPTATDLKGAQQIATHVAPRYQLDNGKGQLVLVQAQEPKIQDVPISLVAIRDSSRIKGFSARNSVVYVLCGLGERCSIDSGNATNERARLLRREALELALYTFKYIKGTDSVIAFLPPPPASEANWSVFFRKEDLKDMLSRPLQFTLPTATKLTPSRQTAIGLVEEVTRPRWFRSSFQQAQDGGAVLVLDPLNTSE
jgi:hypothetical protein